MDTATQPAELLQAGPAQRCACGQPAAAQTAAGTPLCRFAAIIATITP